MKPSYTASPLLSSRSFSLARLFAARPVARLHWPRAWHRLHFCWRRASVVLSRLSNSSLKNLPLVVYKLRKFKKKMLTKRQLKHSLVGSNKPCRKKRRVKVTTSICYRVVERGGGSWGALDPPSPLWDNRFMSLWFRWRKRASPKNQHAINLFQCYILHL